MGRTIRHTRNWLAVDAHFRKAGAIKDKRREVNWKDEVESLEEEHIYLYLDDIRNPSTPNAVVVRTVEEAKEILLTGKVDTASLDHDLGTTETGYDLVCWMEENNTWPKIGCKVHSMNPVGRQKMQIAIDRHYKK